MICLKYEENIEDKVLMEFIEKINKKGLNLNEISDVVNNVDNVYVLKDFIKLYSIYSKCIDKMFMRYKLYGVILVNGKVLYDEYVKGIKYAISGNKMYNYVDDKYRNIVYGVEYGKLRIKDKNKEIIIDSKNILYYIDNVILRRSYIWEHNHRCQQVLVLIN